ncbi:MAG: hypothetical protein HQK65_07805 [Desulfamplus sp.]|nr:hypothetical protein [Desulfamplus sp.]
MQKTTFIVPDFFRILIIDDQIAGNRHYRDYFTSFFKITAIEHGLPPSSHVDVSFEQYPERGIERWAAEVFDLTLIDLDFSKTKKASMEKRSDPHSQWAFNAKSQGMTVLRQLHDWVCQEEGRFNYRKEGMDFCLWSGVTPKLIEEQINAYGVNAYKKKYAITKNDPKDSDNAFKNMSELIEKCCKRISSSNNFSSMQKLERLIQAVRMDIFDSNNTPLGGVVCRKDNSCTDACFTDDSKDNLKVVFFTDILKNNSLPEHFLPLSGKITAKYEDGGAALEDLVHYIFPESKTGDIKKKQPDYLKKICKEFAARYGVSGSGKYNQQTCKYKPLKHPDNSSDSLHEQQKFSHKAHSSRKTDYPFHLLLEKNFKNPFHAAATPLTGTTVIGEDRAITCMRDKIIQLLNGPFGGVILKTAYLDYHGQWDDACWPGLHIQSHIRTRCLYPLPDTPALWNTGRTAMETLPPKLLNRLLIELRSDLQSDFQNVNSNKNFNDTFRVIVSLGSKYHHASLPFTEFSAYLDMQTIWSNLFEQVFQNIQPHEYPIVEINVRHFLREIISHFLGGDEYLSPSRLTETAHADVDRFYDEYRQWLRVINDVAVQYKKKLILKFPFRSDTLALIRDAVALRKWHKVQSGKDPDLQNYGIRGITLVNALKTPVPMAGVADPPEHTSAWYGTHGSWGDVRNKKWKYQMSGAQLATYRNQLIAGVVQPDILKELRSLDISLFFSGGIMTKADIDFLEQQVSNPHDEKPLIDYGIQIGTWALLAGNLHCSNWYEADSVPAPKREWMLNTSSCKGKCCELNTRLCPYRDNISKNVQSKKRVQIYLKDPQICVDCPTHDCLQLCKQGNLKLTPLRKQNNDQTEKSYSVPDRDRRILPRISILDFKKCIACGICMQTFYCDAFFNRDQIHIPPNHDPRNCAGCGLCVQLCTSGALRMYRPEEIIILISDNIEHQAKFKLSGIPHIHYSPRDDLSHIKLNGVTESLANLKETNDIWNLIDGSLSKFDLDDFKKKVLKWIAMVWDRRLSEQFVLGEKCDEYDNDDRRQDLCKKCQKNAEELLESIHDSKDMEIVRVITYGVMWSQLFWSDPGQIFWHTPIITLFAKK